jgi:hypothetical protein
MGAGSEPCLAGLGGKARPVGVNMAFVQEAEPGESGGGTIALKLI